MSSNSLPMARHYCSVLVLLGFVAAAAAVAGGAGSTAGSCEASALAGELAASCAAGAVTPPCCEPVVASAAPGAACFCRVASEMPVLHAGLNASALLALLAGCGGARPLPACDVAVAGPMTVRALSAAAVDVPAVDVVTGLSSDCAGVPEAMVASCLGGPILPPPPPPPPPAVVVRLPSKERNVIIGAVVFMAIQLSLWFGIGVYKLYRRCYP